MREPNSLNVVTTAEDVDGYSPVHSINRIRFSLHSPRFCVPQHKSEPEIEFPSDGL